MSSEKLMEVKGGGRAVNLENIRRQVRVYEGRLREYLESHEANIDEYKFSVEKQGENYIVDVAVRARIHPRMNARAKAGIPQ